MSIPPLRTSIVLLLGSALLPLAAQTPAPVVPKPLLVSDPTLRVDLFATVPEVEACTTVCAAPDGSVYVGNDVRDERLNTDQPVCQIVRFSSGTMERKRTVFADKLYSPAGSLWYDGWLYVIHDPLMSRFKDTDGDGVADVREDLITNLGIKPNAGLNDHVVSGFTLGMDGWFYISVGDRGIFEAKSNKDGSMVTLQGGGIVRCRPDGSQLEIFSGGTRNHLEVDLDAFDRAFTRDNTDDGNGWWTRVTHHIEGGYYGYPFYFKEDTTNGLMAPGPQKPQFTATALSPNERFLPAMTDFGGGSPTGGLVYMSDGLPEKYRNVPFFSEWGKAAVYATDLAREGATYKVAKDTSLVNADKGGDFRPMQLSVAPDGSVLIADWGWGGWKAPKTLGAVWRLSWPEARPAPRIADNAPVPKLIEALGHVDRDQRLRAEFALVKQGEPVVPPLIEVLHDAKAPAVKKAHALWALDLIGDGSPELRDKVTGLIRQVLTDSAPEIRAQAVRELAMRNVAPATDEIVKALKDTDPEVRLQAAIGLGRMRAHGAVPALIGALSEEDRWIRFAARVSLMKIADWQQLAPLLKTQDSRVREQAWLAFDSSYDPNAVAVLAPLVHDEDAAVRAHAAAALGRISYLPAAYPGSWWGTQPVKNPPPLNTVAYAGTSKAIEALTAALNDTDPTVALAAAKALAQGIGPEALPALRARLTTEGDPGVRRQLIETLGVQKDPEALNVFTRIALDEKADADFRDTAIAAVANIGGDEAKKTIVKLAGAQLSHIATRKVIEAAGEMKATDAAPAILPRLSDSDPAIRLAAAKTLNSLGHKSWAPGTVDALLTLLDDKDSKIVIAGIEALSNAHDPVVLPRFIALAEKNRYRKETVGAIASLGGEQVMPVLITMLGDKNIRVRQEAAKALRKYRDKAWPIIEQKFLTNELPPEYEPELRSLFESGTLVKWKMIGPFENVWEAVHPPETDALAQSGQPDLAKKYTNAEGKEVGWNDVSGNSDTGLVDLGQVFHTNGMVCAYAYAEIDSPEEADGKLLAGSDDQLAVWLNGKKVHDSGSGSRGFEPDQDQVDLHFKAGKNQLLLKIGNVSGTWQFAARLPGFDGTKYVQSKEPTPEEKQRAYALATKPDGSWMHAGDPKKGEKVFRDPTGPLAGICATCHTVKGQGGQVGPDLSAIAANYKRADLITSILEPSKTIALGFEQVMIETTGGDTFFGALRVQTDDSLTIVGADAVKHVVKKADVKNRTDMKTSLMPQGLTLALKLDDFVNLVSFLETLKGK
ncbi:heme-binding protein [Chthoniobacter flavus Ellin428]|uniref:Heme-binding protein n=1 Tax=Chthoniobacter flavus Ellin428 TaxID=497964 RepID=B4DAV1_9BACT|nr:PVC-type heme-binding CxxCH protein [Chthoniobacter flavus]EDY16423.1 heme-binding protein [Chthoniobacter flavus Ellin428]TCO84564.1 putative membrane-bound dehydrogenase-like protein [Chthoniobacter flavus]